MEDRRLDNGTDDPNPSLFMLLASLAFFEPLSFWPFEGIRHTCTTAYLPRWIAFKIKGDNACETWYKDINTSAQGLGRQTSNRTLSFSSSSSQVASLPCWHCGCVWCVWGTQPLWSVWSTLLSPAYDHFLMSIKDDCETGSQFMTGVWVGRLREMRLCDSPSPGYGLRQIFIH